LHKSDRKRGGGVGGYCQKDPLDGKEGGGLKLLRTIPEARGKIGRLEGRKGQHRPSMKKDHTDQLKKHRALH